MGYGRVSGHFFFAAYCAFTEKEGKVRRFPEKSQNPEWPMISHRTSEVELNNHAGGVETPDPEHFSWLGPERERPSGAAADIVPGIVHFHHLPHTNWNTELGYP